MEVVACPRVQWGSSSYEHAKVSASFLVYFIVKEQDKPGVPFVVKASYLSRSLQEIKEQKKPVNKIGILSGDLGDLSPNFPLPVAIFNQLFSSFV